MAAVTTTKHAPLPALAVAEVHRRVASCSGTHMLSLRQQYLAALLSFQHPQAPRAMPPGARTRGPDAEALARRQDWHTAFCSLYDNFRNGQCSAFYYVAPEVGRAGRGLWWRQHMRVAGVSHRLGTPACCKGQ